MYRLSFYFETLAHFQKITFSIWHIKTSYYWWETFTKTFFNISLVFLKVYLLHCAVFCSYRCVIWSIQTDAWYLEKKQLLTTLLLLSPWLFSSTCSMASCRVGKNMEVWISSSKNMQVCIFSSTYAATQDTLLSFQKEHSVGLLSTKLTITSNDVNIHINTEKFFERLQRKQRFVFRIIVHVYFIACYLFAHYSFQFGSPSKWINVKWHYRNKNELTRGSVVRPSMKYYCSISFESMSCRFHITNDVIAVLPGNDASDEKRKTTTDALTRYDDNLLKLT